MAMQLSAILCVANEERMIEPCLKLLRFADEIVVVVDAASTDQTREIARRYTKHVFTRQLDSFDRQKNFAISKAKGEWVVIVDADERITPALATEIRARLKKPESVVAFRVRFTNFLLGKRIRFGGWTENHIRLIRRDQAAYHGAIHETFAVAGEVGQLRNTIWHFSHRNVESMMLKTVRYGSVQSAEMLAQNHPVVRTRDFFSVPAKEFWKRYVWLRGYRDGTEGAIEAVYQAFSLFAVYVMLWQRQRKPSLEQSYQAFEKKAARNK